MCEIQCEIQAIRKQIHWGFHKLRLLKATRFSCKMHWGGLADLDIPIFEAPT